MKVRDIGIISVLFLAVNVYAQNETYGDLNINKGSFSSLSISEPKPAVESENYNKFILKNKDNSNKSYATRIGVINGTMGKEQAAITINKIEWTITGNLSSNKVNIKVDNDNMLINGNIGNDPVNFNFDWSTEKISMHGNSGTSRMDYTVIWKDGKLTGAYNGFPVSLNFDMKEGIAGENTVDINGVANNNEVDLTFNKISGELTGTMNNESVSLKLVNCDLYDFIEYFFIFIR